MALGFIADETTPEDGGGSSSLNIIDVLNWIIANTTAGGVTPPPV